MKRGFYVRFVHRAMLSYVVHVSLLHVFEVIYWICTGSVASSSVPHLHHLDFCG